MPVFECPNDRSHRSKAEVLEDMGAEFIGRFFMRLPECADCGAQMEIRYYEEHHHLEPSTHRLVRFAYEDELT